MDPSGLAPNATLLSSRKRHTTKEMLAEVDADVYVDATPSNLETGEPGLSHIRQALERGLSVVTAAKGPLVVDFRALVDLARKKGVRFRYEATVAGAIPTINVAEHCFKGNPITRVDGILNGTSNFILTRMAEENLQFPEALREAQELGYAEADPSYDVDGTDAAAKVVILANAVLGLPIKLGDVRRVGVRDVTGAAVRLAKQQGGMVRLIASVDAATGEASVAPRLVAEDSELNVAGVRNVVRYTTKHAVAFTLTGRGAGGRETATALLSDVLTAVGA
jgi:homoserine dehydrogenase